MWGGGGGGGIGDGLGLKGGGEIGEGGVKSLVSLPVLLCGLSPVYPSCLSTDDCSHP